MKPRGQGAAVIGGLQVDGTAITRPCFCAPRPHFERPMDDRGAVQEDLRRVRGEERRTVLP